MHLFAGLPHSLLVRQRSRDLFRFLVEPRELMPNRLGDRRMSLDRRAFRTVGLSHGPVKTQLETVSQSAACLVVKTTDRPFGLDHRFAETMTRSSGQISGDYWPLPRYSFAVRQFRWDSLSAALVARPPLGDLELPRDAQPGVTTVLVARGAAGDLPWTGAHLPSMFFLPVTATEQGFQEDAADSFQHRASSAMADSAIVAVVTWAADRLTGLPRPPPQYESDERAGRYDLVWVPDYPQESPDKWPRPPRPS